MRICRFIAFRESFAKECPNPNQRPWASIRHHVIGSGELLTEALSKAAARTSEEIAVFDVEGNKYVRSASGGGGLGA